MNPRWLEGPEASLQQVLDGREERAALQREWLKKGGVLLCLTLNMPGPVKRFPLADAAFEEGRRLAEQWLQGGGYTLLEQQRVGRPGGLEWYARLAGDPLEVKACVAALEEQEPLGRLLDLDVLQPDGSKVGREQLGLPPRMVSPFWGSSSTGMVISMLRLPMMRMLLLMFLRSFLSLGSFQSL